ncbi:ComEC/Rec2 family competence protein [Flavobacterium selenitireducens]|uniref:ComEC/Rec2 family competence protein n=1 Tax=Flavobacterium selenitireducens TaxID=2722704 RepID=UPI00168B7CEB|nr:ComEC/Rec2 family competence protein [Flavobacterium selenitireducens]MBD3583142.1 ComEC family competence protein [Flavobacterium selenitireducens]
MQILRFPLVRLSLAFVVGIASGHFLRLPLDSLAPICIALSVLVLPGFLWKRFELLHSLLPYPIIALLGAIYLEVHADHAHSGRFLKMLDPNVPHKFSLTIREKLKVSERFRKFVCTVEYIDEHASDGRVLLYLKKADHPADLPVGQKIYVNSYCTALKPPLNPHGFDYSAYLRNKGIYAQVFADTILRGGISKDIWYYSDALRKRILTNSAKGFGKQELEVFHALMLGQQQEIDAETVRNYQVTGVVHILSVSGLHVGFVMLILSAFLRFFPNSPTWKPAKLMILIVGLWSFALLAGLSPSVMRSAATFSFVAFGLHLKRGSNIYNTLASSILVLLAFQPKLLFDVGFQLSYVALFFIVYLKPLFDSFFETRNRILLYLRDTTTVSLSAQIGTLPLSLYYFHQFPGLFLVANLFAIPLLGVIMALGLISSVWACVAPIPQFLAWPTSNGIALLNFLIAQVAKFDGFVFTDIWFPMTLMGVSYVLIFSVGSLARPKFASVLTLLLCVLGIQLLFLHHFNKAENANEWIVFHARGDNVILERNGRNALLFQKREDRKRDEFVLNPYLTHHGLRARSRKWTDLHFFAGKKILILDSIPIFPRSANPQILLLTNASRVNLDRMIMKYRPEIVVADGSNYRSQIEYWKRTCQKRKIPFHATAEKGFYCLKDDP